MRRGDFIKINYTGRVHSTGEIFDLTSEAEAKKEGVFDPKRKYGPVLVIMGAGMIIPGVEKELETMKPGEEKGFHVSPEQAFGSRSHNLIKIVSAAQFTRAKKPFSPVPGMFVSINGREARIQSVSGGRVRVDFNHPLAGKELHYSVKIDKVITSDLEKAKAIIEYFGLPAEATLESGRFAITTEKELPEPVKKLLSETIREWVKGIENVDFSSNTKKTNF